MGYMFHGFSYPDQNPDHNLISRFWIADYEGWRYQIRITGFAASRSAHR